MKYKIKNNNLKVWLILITILVLSISKSALAGPIIQDYHNNGMTITYHEPIGQIFTAEEARINSIGFFFKVSNPHIDPLPLTIRLFEGLGFDGTSLGSVEFELPLNVSGFFDVDFEFVNLTVGNVYSIRIISPSPRWEVRSNDPVQPQYDPSKLYAGGDSIINGIIEPEIDLAFRVLPSLDTDHDGIPDDEDSCPESILEETVVIDDCDSGAENYLLGDDGCTISDLIADCADNTDNHGEFVSCVSQLTNALKKIGLISGKERGAIQSCAAKSNIP